MALVHLFNGLKGNGCPLSVLGRQFLMETPLPWHVTISWVSESDTRILSLLFLKTEIPFHLMREGLKEGTPDLTNSTFLYPNTFQLVFRRSKLILCFSSLDSPKTYQSVLNKKNEPMKKNKHKIHIRCHLVDKNTGVTEVRPHNCQNM